LLAPEKKLSDKHLSNFGGDHRRARSRKRIRLGIPPPGSTEDGFEEIDKDDLEDDDNDGENDDPPAPPDPTYTFKLKILECCIHIQRFNLHPELGKSIAMKLDSGAAALFQYVEKSFKKKNIFDI